MKSGEAKGVTDSEADKMLGHARESARRWLEYFRNINAREHMPKPEPDWEPLHIGFRGDDND